MSTRRLASLVLVGLAGLGCGGDGGGPSGPEPGVLRVTLVTPNADDGAIMLEMTGNVDSIEAATPYEMFMARPTAGMTRVILTGDLTDGLLLRVHVPDVTTEAPPGIQILQVAARDSYLQRPLGGYGLVVQP
ncbi:MAG TPA: hypothetical protein VFO06_09510 [Gemmatimonadales bacterium]|nr:hypothetical protein [Gemmatimonadales bacterium]